MVTAAAAESQLVKVELSYTLPNGEVYALHAYAYPPEDPFNDGAMRDVHVLLAKQLLPIIKEAVKRANND